MASKQTAPMNATKQLSAGVKMLAGIDVASYKLEFLTSSEHYSTGKTEQIVVPFIELGRDKSCVIRFGESDEFVSRKHAAIQMRDKDRVLIAMSQTNPTLINGRPISGEWFLQNGDEIQLASRGPRMRYLTSVTGTSTMGMTVRMQKFVGQALRPYRRTVQVLTTLLILSVTVSGGMLYKANSDIKNAEQTIARLLEMSKDVKESFEKASATSDIQAKKIKEIASLNSALKEQMKRMVGGISAPNSSSSPTVAVTEANMVSDNRKDFIYMIRVKSFSLSDPDGTSMKVNYGWEGTGFLLDDGRFVTCRHVIEAWNFPSDEGSIAINASINNLSTTPVVEYEAINHLGQTISFKNSDFQFNISGDVKKTITTGEEEMVVNIASSDEDWAVTNANKTGSSISYDNSILTNIKDGDKVEIIGYTHGSATQTSSKIEPFRSEAMVGRAQHDTRIDLVNHSVAGGNSGGPVFVKVENGYRVIGILSAGITDGSVAFAIPLNKVK